MTRKTLWMVLMLWMSNGLAGEETLISPGQAISEAKEQTDGKVLSTPELVRPSKGAPFYKVKVLSNGKVKTIRVDATKGQK